LDSSKDVLIAEMDKQRIAAARKEAKALLKEKSANNNIQATNEK
jgi:hypothetical protein